MVSGYDWRSIQRAGHHVGRSSYFYVVNVKEAGLRSQEYGSLNIKNVRPIMLMKVQLHADSG